VNRKALKAALRGITAVLNEPRLDPGQRDQLLKARRVLGAVGRSGKLDGRKVFRSVEIVTNVLLQVVEKDANTKPRRGVETGAAVSLAAEWNCNGPEAMKRPTPGRTVIGGGAERRTGQCQFAARQRSSRLVSTEDCSAKTRVEEARGPRKYP